MERKECLGRPGAPTSERGGSREGSKERYPQQRALLDLVEKGESKDFQRLLAVLNLQIKLDALFDKQLGEDLSKEGADREKLIRNLFEKQITKDQHALERLRRLQSRKK